MPYAALDNLDRTRFFWPEPLLIDVISDCYGQGASASRITAARHHTQFLRILVEGDRRRSTVLRLELIAFCAGHGISLEAIEAADQRVFRELLCIVDERFRNSPRLRQHFASRLCEGRARLPTRTQPRQQTAPQARSDERRPSTRPLVNAGYKRAVRG